VTSSQTVHETPIETNQDFIMKNNIIPKFFLSFVILASGIAISGAYKSSQPATSNVVQSNSSILTNNCITPEFTFAYPVKKNNFQPESNHRIIYPPDPWKPEAKLPEFTENGEREKDWLVAVRSNTDKSQEIWVLRSWDAYTENQNSLTTKVEFLVYDTNKEKWNIVPGKIKDTNAIAGNLFITSDGSVWAQNYWEIYFSILEPPFIVGKQSDKNEENFPLLSRYDEDQNLFVAIENTKLLTQNGKIPCLSEQYQKYIDWNKVILDKNDLFWIFNQLDGIYSFNPVNQKVNRVTNIPNDQNTGIVITSSAIAPDNAIFVSDNYSSIMRFDPKTSTLSRIGGSPLWFEPTYSYFRNILVDHSGKLWVGDIGWIEPDSYNNWYQLFPSPIFITNDTDGKTLNAIERATIMNESSDHLLWYTFSDGLVSLDPEAGKWCWVSTEHNNIIKDNKNSLWTIAGNNIYRYPGN
jgi:hypothetical protein